MRKGILSYAVAVMAVCTVASGCSNHDDFFDGSSDAKKNQYEISFKNTFGAIDPTQDWGFGGTRGANTNLNQWFDPNYYALEEPAPITQEEHDKVLAAFSREISRDESENVNWSDFFVQHVHKGTATTKTWPDQNGGVKDIVGGDYMDHLYTRKTENGNAVDEHVNNFNAANGSIMLMQNSGTESFGYHNSLDNNIRFGEYVILEIDGSYYVGFDFNAFTSDERQNKGYLYGDRNADGDGIYNDWIVKISPAVYQGASRIVCEDLGTIGDFDFNDVVFDAAKADGQWVITAHAAGGTLPLSVGGKEIHEAFGVPTGTMVNTGGGSVSRPIAIFRIPGTESIKDINITVKETNGAVHVLDAKVGEAPQKICVPTTFRWCIEKTSIKAAYPGFAAWVNSKNENMAWYTEFVEGTVMK